MTERILLLVDDEENIVRALTRVLRRDGYQILFAQSGESALELLETNPRVGVILSDQRMPTMNGAEFLSKVKDRYPDTVRLMLSGYTDLQSVTEAINKGAIYKFLTKPWDDDLLRANIKQAFEQYELRGENQRLSSELAKANLALEQRVEDQSRVIDINQRVLEVSREILEHLPLGVLGVDSDGTIAVANNRMHQILGIVPGALLGTPAVEMIPETIRSMGCCTTREMRHDGIDLGGRRYTAYCAPVGAGADRSGCMLVLAPEEGM